MDVYFYMKVAEWSVFCVCHWLFALAGFEDEARELQVLVGRMTLALDGLGTGLVNLPDSVDRAIEEINRFFLRHQGLLAHTIVSALEAQKLLLGQEYGAENTLINLENLVGLVHWLNQLRPEFLYDLGFLHFPRRNRVGRRWLVDKVVGELLARSGVMPAALAPAVLDHANDNENDNNDDEEMEAAPPAPPAPLLDDLAAGPAAQPPIAAANAPAPAAPAAPAIQAPAPPLGRPPYPVLTQTHYPCSKERGALRPVADYGFHWKQGRWIRNKTCNNH